MTLSQAERSTTGGAFWAIGAVFFFSSNDVLVKFLSGGYPLYELMFVRSMTGVLFILGVIVPLTGSYSMLKTRRFPVHILRGLCVIFANFFFFLGLAALPLADAVAIFFISPMLISLLSILFLGETVGPRRWAAIAVGFIGVLIVLRPGTTSFQVASLLPLVAACGYAMIHILTRRIGGTENATAMVFYIQSTFFVVACVAGLGLGHGGFDAYDHPSLHFLLQGWIWPDLFDLFLMAALGISSSCGGFMISEAYRKSEAALVAPFEYVAMPLAVFWGLTVFGEFPDLIAWAGIGLIMASGLVLIWREAVARRGTTIDGPKRL